LPSPRTPSPLHPTVPQVAALWASITPIILPTFTAFSDATADDERRLLNNEQRTQYVPRIESCMGTGTTVILAVGIEMGMTAVWMVGDGYKCLSPCSCIAH